MRFIIRGIAVAQGRPRFARIGKFVSTYDPAKSRNWKEDVKMQILAQHPQLLEGPLRMQATFILPRPKSLPKKVQCHIKKPDITNLIKGCEDAMRGICYRDDSQITMAVITKVYEGSAPYRGAYLGVVIDLEPVDASQLGYLLTMWASTMKPWSS